LKLLLHLHQLGAGHDEVHLAPMKVNSIVCQQPRLL